MIYQRPTCHLKYGYNTHGAYIALEATLSKLHTGLQQQQKKGGGGKHLCKTWCNYCSLRIIQHTYVPLLSLLWKEYNFLSFQCLKVQVNWPFTFLRQGTEYEAKLMPGHIGSVQFNFKVASKPSGKPVSPRHLINLPLCSISTASVTINPAFANPSWRVLISSWTYVPEVS